MKMFFSWKALELHHESMKKTEIYCNSSNILHESNITRSCRWHLAYILHSLLLYVNKHQNILNYQNTFMALLENKNNETYGKFHMLGGGHFPYVITKVYCILSHFRHFLLIYPTHPSPPAPSTIP